MTIDTDDLLNSIVETFGRMSYIKADEIPNIDLYMDQVTTFMDERLKSTTRNASDDKLMTKTMINNYTKNDVIPPPVKKKYNKDHLLILIMIYYFKSILQINDIKELLDPIVSKYYGSEKGITIEEVFNVIFEDKKADLEKMCDEVVAQYKESLEKFPDAPDVDREYLQLFSFICTLGCDVFVKKLMIEKIVDSLREHRKTTSSEGKDEAKEDGSKKGKEKNKYMP